MAAESSTVNVTELVDSRPLGSYQMLVFGICVFVALMDGFDSQAIGVTAPLMLHDLHLQPAQLGAVFSGSSWGFLAGALAIGPCADRWGRKPFLVATTLLFGVGMLVTPWAPDYLTLLVLRFVTGIGFGGAAPCFVSIATEYAPRRIRAMLVTVLWAALPGGGMIVGLLGPFLLSSFGWPSVFYTGSAISLVAGLIAILVLPESLVFLVAHGADPAHVRRLLMRVAPDRPLPAASRYIVTEETKAGVPVRHLFTEGRAITTLLLWVAFFIDYFALLGMLIWTPSLLKQIGMTAGQASVALAVNNVGGIVGCLVAGYLIGRFGPYRILIPTFLAAFVTIALTGYAAPGVVPVAILQTLDGLLIGGGGAGLIAFAALLYPTYMRSTGVGWGMGIARTGGASGPILGGILLGSAWSPAAVFVAFGLVALPAALTMFVMQVYAKRRARAGTASALGY